MTPIKTLEEIEVMAKGGKILAGVLEKVLAKAAPGITTQKLDQLADDLIVSAGAKPSFKTEKGYHYATCMCINDMVVHGIPSEYKLKTGDILGIDLGVYFKGFHTDGSWTIEIQNSKSKTQNSFLETGRRALELAIKKCVPGNHIGDISKTIEDTVTGGGYTSVKQLVGHGVGRSLHEDPEIPCYLRGEIKNTPEIKVGMVLAIEVIYNQGKSPVVYANNDGWTIVTRDGLPSALFEHTVAITEKGPQVLTMKSAKLSV